MQYVPVFQGSELAYGATGSRTHDRILASGGICKGSRPQAVNRCGAQADGFDERSGTLDQGINLKLRFIDG